MGWRYSLLIRNNQKRMLTQRNTNATAAVNAGTNALMSISSWLGLIVTVAKLVKEQSLCNEHCIPKHGHHWPSTKQLMDAELPNIG
jgi:hypothetical protein